MKKKKVELLLVFILLAAIFSMLLYSTLKESFRIVFEQDNTISLNQRERAFLAENREVCIEVSEELEYLNFGFLEEYVESIVEPSGLKVRLVSEGKAKKDALITVMNDEKRKQLDEFQFSGPLFQISGTLFLRADYEDSAKGLKGVCVKGQFTENEKKTISYDGKRIYLIEVESEEAAVDFIKAMRPDCILGDGAAITSALKKCGLDRDYKDMFADFFEENVCIMVPSSNIILYNIINQCIYSADLNVLMGRAQQQWFGISESFVREERYKDAAALLIVVFAAVFVTFFIYYKANRTLYDELTDRMNQLRASKQEMQTTFNGVSYYMAELDPNGVILDINRAFRSYVNKDVLGCPIGEALELPGELQEALEKMIFTTRQTGKGTSQEISLKRNILEVNIFSIQSSKGEIEKLLFMASDVTGERMAERQMLQDNKMIAVGQLAAGVAHEIRNPLGVIRNYCYVLKNMKDEKSQKQAIQTIERSVDTAGDIIENLLNFSRVSDKRISEVFIREHIDSVISLNNGMLKKKQIAVSLKCREDFKVKMATESFDMIFINLVANAVDAMESMGRLTISIERDEQEFSLEVADTGTGIEQEILNDIFNPFFTTKGGAGGTGLGLYIVYNEVQKMNGDITVNSSTGVGTTFRVVLPVRAEEDSV